MIFVSIQNEGYSLHHLIFSADFKNFEIHATCIHKTARHFLCLSCDIATDAASTTWGGAVLYTVELQWLEHHGDHENMFQTGVVQADECQS